MNLDVFLSADTFLQTLLFGITIGAVYALIALGYTLVLFNFVVFRTQIGKAMRGTAQYREFSWRLAELGTQRRQDL